MPGSPWERMESDRLNQLADERNRLRAEVDDLIAKAASETKRAEEWAAYADSLRCSKCGHEKGPVAHPKGLAEDGYVLAWVCPCACHLDPEQTAKLLTEMRRYVVHHGLLIGECVAWNKLKKLYGVIED